MLFFHSKPSHFLCSFLWCYFGSSQPWWPIRITDVKLSGNTSVSIPKSQPSAIFILGGGVGPRHCHLNFFFSLPSLKISPDDSHVHPGLRKFSLPHVLTKIHFSTLSQRIYNNFSYLNNYLYLPFPFLCVDFCIL